MSLQRTLFRYRTQSAFGPFFQPRTAQFLSTQAISTKPYIYEPCKTSYNLSRLKWDEPREVYETHGMSYNSALAQINKCAPPIVDPTATSYASPDYSCADTATTYKAHPAGYKRVPSRIAEAKREMLERIIKSPPPKPLARKMIEDLPDKLSVIEEINEECKELKERADGHQAVSRAKYWVYGVFLGACGATLFDHF